MPKRVLYPGQLPTWRLESIKPETQAKSERQTKRAKELANIRLHNFRARIISNQDAENARAMEEMEELASYRYFGFHDSANFIRLEELDYDFQGMLKKERNWPISIEIPGHNSFSIAHTRLPTEDNRKIKKPFVNAECQIELLEIST